MEVLKVQVLKIYIFQNDRRRVSQEILGQIVKT